MQVISIYDNERQSKNGGIIDTDTFFAQIKSGLYKDKVDEIRVLKYNFKLEEERCKNFSKEDIKNDEKYQKAKAILKEKKGLIHRVTVSGKFSDDGRVTTNLVNHSGLIDIDIDKLENDFELKSLKGKLILDKYCQVCFITCGGDGLSFICRIDPNKISESYEGLKEYFFKNYGISIDPTHKSIANTRNASYDPDIYIRDTKSPVFKEYPKEKKKKEISNKFVYSKTDFDDIIKEIVARRLDFCDTYERYMQIGFAIASKFGADGSYYFHACCQYNDKYNEKNAERDYKYFCKNPDGGIKIATFYARCKELNVETSSKDTARIAGIASASRKGGKTKEDTIKNIIKHEDYTKEQCEDIVNQVFDEKIEFEDSKSILTEIEFYIKHNYELVKNKLTGKLENDGVEWNEEDLNGLHIDVKKAYETADSKWIDKLIFSPFIKSYNPITDYFQRNLDRQPDELLDVGEIPSIIKKFWSSVKTDNPYYILKFGTKWLVSIVASAHGQVSNLELVFTGKLNEGKSYFFKYFLPKDLLKYFAESKLDKGTDDEILMCQKLIILNDECSGKSRQDEKNHKRMLDKDKFSLRRPYMKSNEDIQRLAVLCGTSNPQNLLTDTHGNRRIIPINVLSRDHKLFDSIDKDELMMACYYLWKQGFQWKIVQSEIEELNQSTKGFQDYTLEYELLKRYYESYDGPGCEFLSASDIKVIIESKSSQKLNLTKLNSELKRLNFKMDYFDEQNLYKVRFKNDANPRIDNAKAQDYF